MSVTLSDLRTAVRSRADMENSDFVSDSELDSFINGSYAELYDLLVVKFEDYFMADPLSFTLSGSTTTYALPEDFYKLRGVDRGEGSNWTAVSKFTFNERNRGNTPSRFSSTDVKYRVTGGNLRFLPEGNCSGTYRMWYVPRVTRLEDASDEISGVMDFEEYVIVDAAIKCLVKEESDPSALLAAKDSLTRRILALAAGRDSSQPEKIVDVTGPSGWWES